MFARFGAVVMFASLSFACQGTPLPLEVHGALTVSQSGTNRTFLRNDLPVRLYDDRGTPPVGSLAGHCILRVPESGASRLEFAVGRSGALVDGAGNVDPNGLRSILIRADDIRAPAQGEARATLGTTEYVGQLGSSCTVVVDHFDPRVQFAQITVSSCMLTNGANTAALSGSVELSGCEVAR